MKRKSKNQVIHAVSEALFQSIEAAKTPADRRLAIVGFVRAASILMNECAEAYLLGHSIASMIMARSKRKPGASCRICGCTNHFSCSTSEGPCRWIEPGLCSACKGIELPPEYKEPWLLEIAERKGKKSGKQ